MKERHKGEENMYALPWKKSRGRPWSWSQSDDQHISFRTPSVRAFPSSIENALRSWLLDRVGLCRTEQGRAEAGGPRAARAQTATIRLRQQQTQRQQSMPAAVAKQPLQSDHNFRRRRRRRRETGEYPS